MNMLENDLNYTEQMGGVGVVIHMGIATKKLMGKADGKTISTIVRNNLT